jgi:hypothetical protein
MLKVKLLLAAFAALLGSLGGTHASLPGSNHPIQPHRPQCVTSYCKVLTGVEHGSPVKNSSAHNGVNAPGLIGATR